MLASEAPRFLLAKPEKPRKPSANPKRKVRKAKAAVAPRFAGDTGTPEMKQRQAVVVMRGL